LKNIQLLNENFGQSLADAGWKISQKPSILAERQIYQIIWLFWFKNSPKLLNILVI